MAECRSCGASIRWVETIKGKRIPLNRDPDPVLGNVRPVSVGVDHLRRAHVLTNDEAAAARADGEDLWTSHFATCPQASEHRKGSG